VRQCSKDALNAFNASEANLVGSISSDGTRMDTYTNHYNTTLGKCFIDINDSLIFQSTDAGGKLALSTFSENDLIDVAENKTVLFAIHDPSNNTYRSLGQSISESDFKAIENQYMTQ
jgi:hypothetical protein